MVSSDKKRTIVFISKATPGDDAFTLWLAPRLEGSGYKVFADILQLDAGDSWRKKITSTLQDESAKMLLCCSDETLKRDGVLQEVAIASELAKRLPDPNFILPLRIKKYKPVFGIADLQYIDFENGWSDGLISLLASLERQDVPKASTACIQSEWAAYHRRKAIVLLNAPEILTSNWLRIVSVPDTIRHIVPVGQVDVATLKKALSDFPYPLVEHGHGFLTFAECVDFDQHLSGFGSFCIDSETTFHQFSYDGFSELNIESIVARRYIVDLFRQGWEKHCKVEGFLEREFANGMAQFVPNSRAPQGKRIPWGRQGQRRSSMLRNVARDRLWEYGVSVRASLFPFPHFRLKSRVLFSDLDEHNVPSAIGDVRVQHRLRRSIAGGWRNRAWHGRLMAFMEVLAGESPYVMLPLGSDGHILVDAMPIQATSPVSARQTHYLGEDGEETDVTTLNGYLDDEDV